MRVRISLVLAVCAAAACVVDTQAMLMEKASKSLTCSREQLKAVPVGDNATQTVSGCGREATFTWPSNGGWMQMQDLRKRAAFDMSCAESQIQLTPLSSGTTMGASGCGRKITYVYTVVDASQMYTSYDWVANTASAVR